MNDRIYVDDLNMSLEHCGLSPLHADFNNMEGMTLDQVVQIVAHKAMHEVFLTLYCKKPFTKE